VTPQTVNRLTAGLAIGVFLLLSLVLANLPTPQRGDTVLRRPSTFFTDQTGARALFLVIRQFSPAAEQWRRSFQFLPAPQEAGTLFIAGPQRPLDERDAEALEDWLHQGGQLILLSSDGWPMRRQRSTDAPQSQADRENKEEGEATFLRRWEPALAWTKAAKEMRTGSAAEGLSSDGEEMILGWRTGFRETGKARVIARAENVPLAVEIPFGYGRILAIADPMMASNAALRRSDNGVWLGGLILNWNGGKILFDEYHHGFGQKRGTAELTRAFFQTPWGWCVLQLALAGLLYVFGYRRRFGRVREPLTIDRSSPLELIGARAGLFQTARAQRLAADLIVQHLCQDLGTTRGKLVDSTRLEEELESVLRRSGTGSDHGLRELFGKVQSNQELTEREFVQLGIAAGEIIKRAKA
jgi:hypothetical protein